MADLTLKQAAENAVLVMRNVNKSPGRSKLLLPGAIDILERAIADASGVPHNPSVLCFDSLGKFYSLPEDDKLIVRTIWAIGNDILTAAHQSGQHYFAGALKDEMQERIDNIIAGY